MMPLKRKPMPTPDGSILTIQPLNALGSSVDENTRNTLVESKLPSKL